ncbi:MAG: Ig-like domain-containing protein [Geminicoccaceae bacterium]
MVETTASPAATAPSGQPSAAPGAPSGGEQTLIVDGGPSVCGIDESADVLTVEPPANGGEPLVLLEADQQVRFANPAYETARFESDVDRLLISFEDGTDQEIEGYQVTAQCAVGIPGAEDRVQVPVFDGQQVILDGALFESARLTESENGLLIVLDDGRSVLLVDFFDGGAAELSINGNPFFTAASLQQTLVASESALGEDPAAGEEPTGGPEDAGGGAGFTPFDPGSLPDSVDPLGPLGPTALAFESAAVAEDEEDFPSTFDSDDDDDDPIVAGPDDPDDGGIGGPLPANVAPVAGDDAFEVAKGTTLAIAIDSLLSNDTDANNDPLEIVSTSAPNVGSIDFDEDGNLLYTAPDDFEGTDSFTYEVSDGRGGTDTAEVQIGVFDPEADGEDPDGGTGPDGGDGPGGEVPANQAPVAVDDTTFNMRIGSTLLVSNSTRLRNDFDPDGDPISIVEVGEPTVGTIDFDEDGNVLYTAPPGFIGFVTFPYTVADPSGATDTAIVSIRVGPRRLVEALSDEAESGEPLAAGDVIGDEASALSAFEDGASNRPTEAAGSAFSPLQVDQLVEEPASAA